MTLKMMVKRIYESADSSDGYRILVDRLWPQGVSKQKAHLNLWAKEVAPSDSLRQAFHKGQMTGPEFEKAYKQELKNNPNLDAFKKILSEHKTITFLYASKDTVYNNARVLADFLA